jgi:tetratricopeptide (TPR) repeat protein
MASYNSADGDPNAGRHTLWIVAGIGIAAVVGYGVVQAGRAARAPTDMPAQPETAQTARASITELTQAVEGARQDLDVAALAKLEEQLATAAEQTTMQQRAAEARLARLEALSTRALEAAVRSKQPGADIQSAERTRKVAITQGRSALANLRKDKSTVDPARLRAAEARLALADGNDITQSHPVVLLPTFRDPELRLAALSRPVWFEQREDGEDEVVEVVEELERADPKSALTRALLAVALHSKGDDEAAQSEVDTVLQRVPGQPLALVLKRSIAGGIATVAVAEPPEPADHSAGTPPEPQANATANEPEPEPEPETKTAPPPIAPKPTGTKLEPVDTEPVEPPKPKPEPKPEPKNTPQTEPPKPKPKPQAQGFDELVAQGCKDVRSGDAEGGLAKLRKAFDIKPGSTKVTLCMAEGQDKLGRTASAAALVDRVLRSSPSNVKALLLAAKLADKTGNKAAALAHYRKVLEVQPDNAKAKAYVDNHG